MRYGAASGAGSPCAVSTRTRGTRCLLALSEACNNAIEHGYRNRPGTISIALSHDDASLEIRVADNGEWREPRPDSSRGRGMLIMRSLMDEADVVSSQDGTEVVLGQRL